MAANTQPYGNDFLRSDPLLVRIWREFVEMPGLRLTAAQAQRLWTVDRATCTELLEQLVTARLLIRMADGRYARALPYVSTSHAPNRAIAS
jgi:hypothetical protein